MLQLQIAQELVTKLKLDLWNQYHINQNKFLEFVYIISYGFRVVTHTNYFPGVRREKKKKKHAQKNEKLGKFAEMHPKNVRSVCELHFFHEQNQMSRVRKQPN